MNKYVTKAKKIKSGRIISFLLAVSLLITSIHFAPLKGLADKNINVNAGQAISEEVSELEQSAESEAVTLSAEEITTLRAEMNAELATSKIFDYVDESQFVAANHVSRLHDEEELNTYVFLNEDGSHTMYLLDENVKYVAEDGSIKEKDVTLVQKGNTSSGDVSVMSAGLIGGNAGTISGDYTVKSNNIGLILPNDISKGIELTHGTKKVTLTPLGISNLSANLKATANASLNTVAYDSAYGNGVSLKYTPTLSGIKEDIVLSSYTGVNSFSFTLATNGMCVYTDVNGDYYIAETEDSVQRFCLGRIVVYDANLRQSLGNMTVETVKEGQLYLLTVSADESFLLDSETVYPVTVDPSITVRESSDGSGIIDTTVCDKQKGTSYYEELLNYVGYVNDERGTAMTFMRLDGLANNSIYKTLSSAEITNVDVNVYGTNSTMAVNLYRVTKNISIDERLITWNTVSGNYSTTTNRYVNIGGNTFNQLDITPFVKGWKSGSYTNSMSFVVAPAGTNANYCARFISSEHSSAIYRPYITLDYTFKNLIDDGVYFIENKQLGKYLRPKDGVLTDGNSMELWSYSGEIEQKWMITSLENGYYKISSLATGYLLSVEASDVSKENGAVVQETRVDGATRQQWRIYRTIYGGLAIKPRSAGTGVNVLSVSDGNNGNGAVVSQRGYAYNDSFKDEWYLCPIIEPGEIKYIKNKQLNLYVRPKDNSKSDWWEIELWQKEEESAQKWIFTPVGNGYYSIINEDNWYALSVMPTQIGEENGIIIQETYTGDLNQQWKVYLSVNNGYYIKPRSAGTTKLVLSVCEGVTTNGAVVSQREEVFNQSYKEEWLLESYIPISNGIYYIKNHEIDKYIDARATSSQSVSQKLYDFSLEYNQQWQFSHIGNGYYKIISVLTGYALSVDLNDISLENGDIIQANYTGATNQQWIVYNSPYGGVVLKPKSAKGNNFVLSVLEGNLGNGANVAQRAYVKNYSYKDEWFLLEKNNEPTLEKQAEDRWCWVAAAKIAASKYIDNIPVTQQSAAVYVKTNGEIDSETPPNTQISAAMEDGTIEETKMAMEYFLGADDDFCYTDRNRIYDLATLKNLLAEGNIVIAARRMVNKTKTGNASDETSGGGSKGHSIVIYKYGGTITDINGVAHDAFWVYDPNNKNDNSYSPSKMFVTYEWLCNTENSVRKFDKENGRVDEKDLYGNNLDFDDFLCDDQDTSLAMFIEPIGGIYDNNAFEWHSICVVKMGSYSETIPE